MKIEEHERGGGYDVWVSDSISQSLIEVARSKQPSMNLMN